MPPAGKRAKPAPRPPQPSPPPEPPLEPLPRNASSRNAPEKKFGPYRGGIGVAVWLNTVETEEGPRQLRSITLAPRRYFDRNREEWRDSKSYRPYDLEVLIFALRQAQAYIYTTPVPGEKPEDEDVPF